MEGSVTGYCLALLRRGGAALQALQSLHLIFGGRDLPGGGHVQLFVRLP